MSKPDQSSIRPEGISAVTAPIEAELHRLESFLATQVEAFEPEVRPLVEYTLLHSGKKLRPILVFFAGWQGPCSVSDELIRAGAVVELVHLATLVHDDILDAAGMRHRMPTVAAKYGADAAVLLGDALFAHALELAASYPTVDVCRAVSRATRQVCTGEIAQTFARGEVHLTKEAYYRMIDLKTAELFAVAAWLGAFLTEGKGAFTEAVEGYARSLGVAYQIFDDVADFLSEEQKAGKTLGTDLQSGKFTLPVLLFLEGMEPQAAADWAERLRSGAVSLENLRTAMQEAGVFLQVAHIFKEHLYKGRRLLEPYADRPSTTQLFALGDFVGQAMNRFAPYSGI